MNLLPFALVLIRVLTGCGLGRDDRQELIDRLRTIGVAASPLVSTPGKTVDLTLYAAVPVDRSATIAPFKDSVRPSSGAFVLDPSAIVIDQSSVKYVPHNGLQLMTASAKITLPPASAFKDPLGGQVEYGFLVTSDGHTEKIIGDVLVAPAGSPNLALQNPVIDISTPLDGTTIAANKDVDAKAVLTNPNNEDVKLGWFCSSGTIQNRRALETTFHVGSGRETLILVAHGIKSRGFAVKVVEVTSN